MRSVPWLATIAAFGCAAGCASHQLVYPPREVRAYRSASIPAEERALLDVPYEIDDELAQLASRLTGGAEDPRGKLEALVTALGRPGGLNLHYESGLTTNARQTVVSRAGDCMSLTSLFVGMARSIGLPVFFLDARGVQSFTSDGELMVDQRHIVAGFGRAPEFTIVDFDRISDSFTRYRLLSDLQAVARFHNNLGFDALRKGDTELALRHFRLALRFDPSFAAAHNNLGVALSRAGRYDDAERHLLAALRADPDYAAPVVNLAGVLTTTGREAEADQLYDFVERRRLQDPVLRLRRGVAALREGDGRRAVQELRTAVALDARLVPAWAALAQAYESLGDARRALQAAKRALDLDPGQPDALAVRDRLAG
jgi:Flp pilus assembly protein TadD